MNTLMFQKFFRRIHKLLGIILKISTLSKNDKRKDKKKRARAKKKAAELQYRLMNLGFTERAVVDLQTIVYGKKKPFQKRPAARVLARWHANKRDEESARRCLEMLSIAVHGETNQKRLRQAAIMEAECHELLCNTEAGKAIIQRSLDSGPDANLYMVAANLESSVQNRLKWINRALNLHNISVVTYDPDSGPTLFDCIKPKEPLSRNEAPHSKNAPKITVIVPVYNAESVLKTAIESILFQSWHNLEVLVVDDCSTDSTAAVIEKYCSRDSRVRLIKIKTNRGAYVARNSALLEATGVFVTCHDADDWSHPQKIEKQALHLLQNPSIIGNTSQHVRITPDLKIYRRGKYGVLIDRNFSSFMFRREPVMKAIGYWDSVRFSADNEFIERIIKVFGDESVVYLTKNLLSFTRQHTGTLTENKYFGAIGSFMGARKHYVEIQQYYHEMADTLYYDFPQKTRPFPVPEPMQPQRLIKGKDKRHFDIILASDFRLPGGTTMSNSEEIRAQKKLGLRTGLVQLSRYDQNSDLKINPMILDLLDGDNVQMIVYGEKVTCSCLIIKHPPVLQERQIFIPEVNANSINVVINQTPKADYGPNGRTVYDIKRCQDILQEYFGKDGTWHPTGPLVRETLHKHHAEEISSIDLSQEDWVEIINVDEWNRPARPTPGPRIRIGRHSRDHLLKWPANQEELLAVYPDNDEFEIHILGGAEAPKNMLGSLPKNWQVLPFGKISPKEFLAKLDVFVYYIHPDMVEAFGRVIIEAMAVGVPVILPFSFQNLFCDSALYAKPSAVQDTVKMLIEDDGFYQSQVERAQYYIVQNFGYKKHAQRITEFITI